jgi:hypothetical protein
MKTYIGKRTPNPVVMVHVQTPTENYAYVLRHVIYHSPAGLEWGYGGSGPADTALSLLADHFEESSSLPPEVFKGYSDKHIPIVERTKAWKMHMLFKHAVVAGLGDAWTITSDTISEHMSQIVSEHHLCPACYGRTVPNTGQRKCTNVECLESPWHEPPDPPGPSLES